ncbi:hypothetical protein PPERSA_05560 [Pseudocohnilembus persalinus]|uniref:Uncharacterized protein n=1 Tax=Pseudocohnilembus persalinus TaxID=266149 RepID=A0A0V0Q7I2_PSEPJ|nr:hypothetical protein PPERSA_05560 [Pseudocohnilembus persalinus]|eukprot:KRW98216.1 hypothetical protein PPERSA_05560 [Pseudocohnilembus persalinus]
MKKKFIYEQNQKNQNYENNSCYNDQENSQIIKQVTKKQNILEKYLEDPRDLKLLILANLQLNQKDLNILQKCQNLIKLDLSSNNIQQFTFGFTLKNCPNLSLLYLHNNQFQDLGFLTALEQNKNLLYLTIFDNQVVSQRGVRMIIINKIQSLLALDFNIVSEEEKYDLVFPDDSKFKNMGPNTKIQWPLMIYPNFSRQLTEQDLMKQAQSWAQRANQLEIADFFGNFLENPVFMNRNDIQTIRCGSFIQVGSKNVPRLPFVMFTKPALDSLFVVQSHKKIKDMNKVYEDKNSELKKYLRLL